MNAIIDKRAVWSGTGRIMENSNGSVPELSLSTTPGWGRWVGSVKATLENLLKLGHNWDGRGSGRISPDTASFAFQLMTQTMPPIGLAPAIVPLGNGALQLEWHTLAADLEVEVTKPNAVSVWYVNHESEEEEEFETTTDFRHLADLIGSVARG